MSSIVEEKLPRQKRAVARAGRAAAPPKISAIVAIRNHASGLAQLHSELTKAFDQLKEPFEILLVDDGSTDSTYEQARDLASQFREVKSIRLRSSFGEGSAFDAGLKLARGEIIVYLAGRVLINPDSIPRIIESLGKGVDLVVGWRHPRRDSFLNRLVSKVFNLLVNGLSGLRLHDINSGLFVTRREVLSNLPLYGDLHNFVAVLASRQGYRVDEEKVEQMRGVFRTSRYPNEYLRRFLDIITVLFLTNYSKKPLHFLGFLGGLFALIGGAIETYLFFYRIFGVGPIAGRPLLLLGALLLVIGLQMISIGLIGEMIIFTHADDVKEYNIAEIME